MRLMIRAAIQSSPSTTPIKGLAARDAALMTFRDTSASESFDYGVGQLKLTGEATTTMFDIEDDDDSNNETDIDIISQSPDSSLSP